MAIVGSPLTAVVMLASAGPPEVQATAGPLLLGYLFNWTLYGILSVQVYVYYMAFPNDRLAVRLLVYGLFLIETVQSILLIRDAFIDYAIGFDDAAGLNKVHFAWLSIPIFCGIVSCTVQIFFAFRIYILSQSKTIGVFICMIAFTEFVGSIVQGVQTAMLDDFAALQKHAWISGTVWLCGNAVCDVMIAGLMCYFLSRMKTGFGPTTALVARLMRLTVGTGTLTASIATLDFVVFLVFPQNNYHITFSYVLAKLYSNTLVMIFNSRLRIVGGRDESQSTELAELGFASTWQAKEQSGGELTVKLPGFRRTRGEGSSGDNQRAARTENWSIENVPKVINPEASEHHGAVLEISAKHPPD